MANRPVSADKAYLYYIRDGKLQEIEGSVQAPASYQKKTWFKWCVTDVDDVTGREMIMKIKELQISAEENVVFNENVWYREPNKNQAAVALAAYYMDRKNDCLRRIEQYDDKIDACLKD